MCIYIYIYIYIYILYTSSLRQLERHPGPAASCGRPVDDALHSTSTSNSTSTSTSTSNSTSTSTST